MNSARFSARLSARLIIRALLIVAVVFQLQRSAVAQFSVSVLPQTTGAITFAAGSESLMYNQSTGQGFFGSYSETLSASQFVSNGTVTLPRIEIHTTPNGSLADAGLIVSGAVTFEITGPLQSQDYIAEVDVTYASYLGAMAYGGQSTWADAISLWGGLAFAGVDNQYDEDYPEVALTYEVEMTNYPSEGIARGTIQISVSYTLNTVVEDGEYAAAAGQSVATITDIRLQP